MTALITIGDFSRMTHLSVKALRHYHEVGLLEPADVDPASGYRLYDTDQIPIAQVIRRFRDLGMPVDEVKSVLEAPDISHPQPGDRGHLERMEDQLEQTKATVASLHAVLEGPRAPVPVEYRSVGATPTLAIRERVTAADIEAWWTGAFLELRKALVDARVDRAGPDGCLYPKEMFELEEGEMVAFVPVSGPAFGTGRGRVHGFELPGAELAIMVHEGSYDDLDQTYGALGTHVAERAIGVEGPIRELYLVSALDTKDSRDLRTDLGWPVFRAG